MAIMKVDTAVFRPLTIILTRLVSCWSLNIKPDKPQSLANFSILRRNPFIWTSPMKVSALLYHSVSISGFTDSTELTSNHLDYGER